MSSSTRHYRIKALGNLELLHTQHVTDGYANHLHEEYGLCYLETGLVKTHYRGGTHFSHAQSFTVMNPGEPHRGEVISEDKASYYSLYISAPALQHFCEDVFGKSAAPYFGKPIIFDDLLGHKLQRLLASLATSNLETETQYLSFLSYLITLYADTTFSLPVLGQETSRIEQAKHYLQNHYQDDVTLDDLARVVGLNRAYLIRAFKKSVGLPPHAYLTQIRLSKAKKQLTQGLAIAEVAANTGFADQSHFSRTFKRTYGMTPGVYSSYQQLS